MNERQEHLLRLIVDAYIERAEPVGSSFIVENYDLGVSPATVRNDMVALEAAGYLAQPHISAGRIPTEEGYQYYLRNFLHTKPQVTARRKLERAVEGSSESEERLKDLARELVALSGETVLLSFGPRRVYYAGLSHLFQKPDFQDIALLQELSGTVDQFEEVLDALSLRLSEEPAVFIGRENPFGSRMSSVMVRYRAPQTEGVLGFIGPMRMDYGANVQLLQMTRELLDEWFT